MDIPQEFKDKLTMLIDDLSEEIYEKGYLDGLKILVLTEELVEHFQATPEEQINDTDFRVSLFGLLVRSMEAALVKQLEVEYITTVEKNLPGLRRRAFRCSMELTVWDYGYRAQADTLLGNLERRFLLEDKEQDARYFVEALERTFAFDTKSERRKSLRTMPPVPISKPVLRAEGPGARVIARDPIERQRPPRKPNRS